MAFLPATRLQTHIYVGFNRLQPVVNKKHERKQDFLHPRGINELANTITRGGKSIS